MRIIISLLCCMVTSLSCLIPASAQLAAPQMGQLGTMATPPAHKVWRVAIITAQVFKSKDLAEEAAKNMAVMANEAEMGSFLFRVIEVKQGFTVALAIRMVFIEKRQAEMAIEMLKQDKNYTEKEVKPNFQIIEDNSF